MKNLNNCLVLSLVLFYESPTFAQIMLDDKSTSVFSSAPLTQIVISGNAALDLYKDLSQREGIQEFACGEGRAISVDPFLCIQKDGSAICISNIFPTNERFVIPDSCDGPNPTAIDLGINSRAPELKQAERMHRSQL